MSDDSSAPGTRPSSSSGPGGDGGWTPPPPSRPPPPDTTGQVPAAVPTRTGPNLDLSAGLVLAVLAVIGIVLALFIKESPAAGVPSANLWDQLSELWAIVAIIAAVATLVPGLRAVINLDAKLAWTIGAAGAAYLVLWWVLFILPNINLNVSFLATLAVAAALAAVWTSAGNPYKPADGPGS